MLPVAFQNSSVPQIFPIKGIFVHIEKAPRVKPPAAAGRIRAPLAIFTQCHRIGIGENIASPRTYETTTESLNDDSRCEKHLPNLL